MGKIKNLLNRDGMFYARKAVPLELRTMFAPRREIKRSLHTGERKEAERRLPATLAEIESEFQAARETLKAAQREGEFIRSTAFRGAVERARDVASSIGIPSWDLPAPVQHPDGSVGFPQQWEPYPSNRGGALEEIETALDELEAEQAAATLAVGTDPDGEPRWTVPYWMVNDLTDRMNELFEAKRRTLEAARAQIEAKTEEEARAAGDGLSTLLVPWEVERKPRPRSILDAKKAIAEFEAACGPLAYKDITPTHCLTFKQHLLALDRKAATKNKAWGMVRTLLNTAVGNQLLASSPMQGIKFAPSDDSEARSDLTKADLEAFYATETHGSEDWWLFRICQYTGARLAEIVQLTRDDVVTEDGVLCFRITRREGKSAKTKNSVRLVPVHKQLLTDGLVKWLPSSDRLFARTAPAYSKRLNARLNKAGVDDQAKVVHSLRHTFISACREVPLDEDTWGRLTGHVPQNVGQRYGKHGPKGLKTAIDKVRFGIETC